MRIPFTRPVRTERRVLAWRRPSENRKLRQRRPLRVRIPSPTRAARAAWSGLRRAAPVLGIVAGAAALCCASWLGHRWLVTSPRFAIDEVVVRGHTRVTSEDVVRQSGLVLGENIFAARLDAAADRVAANPWFASVRAARQLPGRVVIDVTERVPAALVILDHAYLADADGRPFKRARTEAGEADGLVVVTGLDRRAFVTNPAAAAGSVREALDAAARFGSRPDRPALGEVRVDPDGITLFTRERAVALHLGRTSGADIDARLERFDVSWSALTPEEQAAARAIHLDSPTRPDRVTIRLADAR